MRFLNWFFFVLSVLGVLTAIVSIIYGSQPCSGDSCIIQVFQLIGVLLLLVCVPIGLFTGRYLRRRYRRSKGTA